MWWKYTDRRTPEFLGEQFQYHIIIRIFLADRLGIKHEQIFVGHSRKINVFEGKRFAEELAVFI
jgi:hypothetical protein